jgi:hypothetical protein
MACLTFPIQSSVSEADRVSLAIRSSLTRPFTDPALWGAEGLFDEGMNEMFFAGYDTAVPTPSAWQSLGL